jgi:hypothetical protein
MCSGVVISDQCIRCGALQDELGQGKPATEPAREKALQQRALKEVTTNVARLKASIVALTIFYTFEDDTAAQAFFQELAEVEARIRALCGQIGEQIDFTS